MCTLPTHLPLCMGHTYCHVFNPYNCCEEAASLQFIEEKTEAPRGPSSSSRSPVSGMAGVSLCVLSPFCSWWQKAQLQGGVCCPTPFLCYLKVIIRNSRPTKNSTSLEPGITSSCEPHLSHFNPKGSESHILLLDLVVSISYVPKGVPGETREGNVGNYQQVHIKR